MSLSLKLEQFLIKTDDTGIFNRKAFYSRQSFYFCRLSMIQPSIHVFGLRIDQPVNMLTDIVVAAVFLYAFIKLKPQGQNIVLKQYYRYFLITMAIGSFLGGVLGHGFLYALSEPWKLPGWLIAIFSVLMLQMAVTGFTQPYLKPGIFKFLNRFSLFEAAFVSAASTLSVKFIFTVIHLGYIMILVTILCLYHYKRSKDTAMKLVGIAALLTIAGGLLFMIKTGIHPWFNHVDVSHIVLAVSAWYFYLGGKRLMLK